MHSTRYAPSAPLLSTLSLPAKSTKQRHACVRSPSECLTPSTISVNIQWDLLLLLLVSVAPIDLLAFPALIADRTSDTLVTGVVTMPTMFSPMRELALICIYRVENRE